MVFFTGCKRVRQQLWDLAANKLSASDREMVEKHVSACDSCRSELELYRKTVSGVGVFRDDPVPTSGLGWQDLKNRVEVGDFAHGGWLRIPAARLSLVGGALAAACVLGLIVVQNVVQNNTARHGSVNQSKDTVADIATPGSTAAPNEQVDTEAPFSGTTSSPDSADRHSAEAGTSQFPHRTASPLRARMPHSHTLLEHMGSNHHGGPANRDTQIARADENVDGASPRQPLRTDYVLTPATSGNDEDQNRRYVIDVVSSRSGTVQSAGDEESHPW